MMKKSLTKLFFFFLATVSLLSCGSSDEEGSGGNQVLAISISANYSTIEIGNSFTFLVRDNNNAIITDQTTIYVNDTAISGATYTPTSSGVFTVYAKYDGLTSPSITVNVNLSPVFASVDKDTILLGGTVSFSATTGGDDITQDATFYIDGTEITGNTFTPSTRGTYIMSASYDGVTSDPVSVYVGFVQNVLVEDYTGAWCGYCPRLAYNLEQAEIQSENVYGVAVHNDDPMAYEFEAQMRGQFGVTGFPSGRINRTIVWSEMVGQILNLTGVNKDLGLGLSSTLQGNTISVDVKIGYNNSVSDIKLVIYLLEDGLLYNQVNYMNNDSSSPWYQAGNPIVGFTHNNVLRKAFTDIMGDVLPNASAGGEYTETFTLQVPSSVQDTSKLQIVAFVVDENKNAINAIRANLGESQDYQ